MDTLVQSSVASGILLRTNIVFEQPPKASGVSSKYSQHILRATSCIGNLRPHFALTNVFGAPLKRKQLDHAIVGEDFMRVPFP